MLAKTPIAARYADVADRAADYVEKHGHSKGRAHTYRLTDPFNPSRCFVAAISMEAGEEFDHTILASSYCLGQVIRAAGFSTSEVENNPVKFNDDPSTTKEMVVAKLRQAASVLRAQAQE